MTINFDVFQRLTGARARAWKVALFAGLAFTFAIPGRCQEWQFGFDANGNLVTEAAENPAPPQILAQPQRQVVVPGELGSFFVLVADARAISYQWRFNNANIGGATSDTLLLTNVAATNEGQYSVVLVNSSGSVTSAPAALMIDSRGCGMPDSWQLAYFSNLTQNASGDFDGDGVSNLQEFLDGTNPTNAASALYRISMFNDGGTVVAVPDQPSYTNGQVVTLTATGSDAAPFHAWTGDVVTRSNSITLTMSANRAVYAHFAPITFQWGSSASGDWNVASNWTPSLVPGSNDSVRIQGPETVTLNSDADLADVDLGDSSGIRPELTGTGTLTMRGRGTWMAGTMSGTGKTIIAPGASFTIAISDLMTLSRAFENGGIAVISGGVINLDGGTITNDAGAVFKIQSPVSFNVVGGSPRFDNAGTVVIATPGTAAIVAPFNNYGTLDIRGGMLSLLGGGIHAGTVTVEAGGTLGFGSGTFTSSGSPSITGAGTLLVIGDSATLGGTVNVSGSNVFRSSIANLTGNYICTNNTLVIGGTANFDGTGVVSPSVLNLSGTLGGADTVTVGSVMNWTGGSMSGSGRTVIPAGATLNIAIANPVFLNNRTLDNGGTTLFSGPQIFLDGGVITNEAGALFEVQTPALIYSAGGSPRFDNAGTFVMGTAGTAAFALPFNNYATVSLQGGVLAAYNGYASSMNAILNCAIWGRVAGTNYGQLQVSGSVALNGTLSVNLTNHFLPAAYDSFTVLTAGTRNGTFANFIYPSNEVSMVLSDGTTSEIVQVAGITQPQTNLLSPAAGIISWWRAENDAVDAIGTNHGALANGATFAVGKVGQSFLLDGIDDYVAIPDSPSLRPASVTLEAWVQFNATDGFRSIMGKPVGSGIFDSFALWLADGVLNGVICDTVGGGPVISYTMQPVLGQWYHLAYTYDGGSLQQVLYVNGAAVASGTGYQGAGYDSHPMLIGSDNDNGTPDGFFSGKIDEAAIYSRALGPNEISAIYNAGPAGRSTTGPYFTNALALANGCTGQAYTEALGTIRGADPVTFALVGGALPGGLSLSSAGVVTGTPTNEGLFNFTIRATDSAALFADQNFSMQIYTRLTPPSGLISWWRAENDAVDAIGTNNGTLTNGATFAAGKVGQSFLLDGIDDYVVIPDSPSLRPASVTLEAWVKTFSITGTVLIFAKPLGSGSLDSYGLALQNGAPLAAICSTNGFGTFLSSAPLVPGQWYHLAFSFDNTTKQEVLYVNGLAVASANAGLSMDYDSHPLLLGADIESGVPSLFLNGQIDEPAIYNRALGANEIASIYNVGSAGKQFFTAYQSWKLAHLNDASAPDLGDPDGDGYVNLLEYGLALYPEVADPAGLPQMGLFDYGGGDKRLRAIVQRDPTHNDVTIEVQGSGSPSGGWQSLAASTNGLPFQGIGYVGGDGAGSGIKTVEIRDSASITNASERFMRVKVSH